MKIKHTQGEWEEKWSNSIYVEIENNKGILIAIINPYKKTGNLQINFEEYSANAELITEAGNVANETGKTPRQLLEERNELLEALLLIDMLYGDRGYFTEPYKSTWIKAKAAIKKAIE